MKKNLGFIIVFTVVLVSGCFQYGDTFAPKVTEVQEGYEDVMIVKNVVMNYIKIGCCIFPILFLKFK